MPLYEITLELTYFGQQCINRWNYVGSMPPEGVSGAFKAVVGMGAAPDTDIEPFGEETILGQLKNAISNQVVFVQMIAKNLYSVTDFYTYAFPPNTNGNNPDSNPMSPTAAFGYASDRTRSDIRRAQKRFVGLSESQVVAGGLIEEATADALQLLGDTMGDVNAVPAGAGLMTFTPHVFGREQYITPSGKKAYKYYDTEAEQLEHIALITAFTLKPQVRTQASRQYGRGS